MPAPSAAKTRRPIRGEKTAHQAAAIGESAAGIHQAAAHGDHAGQGQAHGDEQVGQGDHETWGLQLEAPAYGIARLLQDDQQPRHQHEACDNAGGIQPTVQMSVVVGAACETEHLQ